MFMGIVLATSALVLTDAMFDRETRSQTAASRIGTQFVWPDDTRAADPDKALRILTDAAEATSSNVLRTTVGTTQTGRKRVAHYIFMGRDHTSLFEEFHLRHGRWLSPAESRTDSATVTSAPTSKPGNVVGVPAVFANRYDLTFAPLRRAFTVLPSAGRYIVESDDSASRDRFLAIVHQRLVEVGVAGLTASDLTVQYSQISAHASTLFRNLVYVFHGVAALLVSFILLREGKRIGVLRLLGHSPARIWYRVVGRLQISSAVAGAGTCAIALFALPGADTLFVRTLAFALAEMAMIGFAITVSVGLFIIHRVQVAHLIKGSLQ